MNKLSFLVSLQLPNEENTPQAVESILQSMGVIASPLEVYNHIEKLKNKKEAELNTLT